MLLVYFLTLLSCVIFTVAQHDFEPMNHENWEYLKSDYCDEIEELKTSRILGGSQAKLCEFPWMAGFVFQRPDGSYTRHRCSGTILNNRTILTAAHCFTGYENGAKLTKVSLGGWNKNFRLAWDDQHFAPVIQAINPKEIIIHGRYFRPSFYDIALIRLEEDIQWNWCVNPICVPTRDLMKKDFVGEEASVAGWGTESLKTQKSSLILRKGNFIVKNLADCGFDTSSNTDRLICAVGKETGTDICRGDSGGPLMIKHPDNIPVRHFIIGIVAFGGCNEPNNPPFFTPVATYMEWIMDNLIENKRLVKVIHP